MDNSLSTIPKKKAKLEETRHLLERLEGREGEVSKDRYQRLHERYQTQIDDLEEEVSKLTDRGKTQKIELEDRLALQREKKEEAEKELSEIETLHEQGALDDETYRSQRGEYRGQAKQAEKAIRKHERELDELQYYLNEVGEEPYRGNTLKGQLSEAGDQIRSFVDSADTENFGEFAKEASDKARKYGKTARDRANEWTSGMSRSQKWMLGGGVALVILIVGIFSGAGSSSISLSSDGSLSEAQVHSELSKLINERSEGNIELIDFQKTDAQMRESNGVQTYRVWMNGNIEIKQNCMWNYSDTGVSSKQFVTKDSGVDVFKRLTYGGGFVRGTEGDKYKIEGTIFFEVRESGWVISRSDIDVEATK